MPQAFFLVNVREDGSLDHLKKELAGTTSGIGLALKGGYVKDLRPRVDPVGTPTRGGGGVGIEAGSSTSSLPYQSGATELKHLSHPSALRDRSDPRARVASIPEFHVATGSAMSLAYKLEATQTRRDSNNLTRRRSPRNPGLGGEEKERCFRRYYIRGTRLHHPEKDCGDRHRARKWLHFHSKRADVYL